MFDYLEGFDLKLPLLITKLQGLQGTLTDVNPPNAFRSNHCHSLAHLVDRSKSPVRIR